MEPGAIVGRTVAIGVEEGAGVRRGGASVGGTGVGDGDFPGDGVDNPFVFFFDGALGEPFFFFFDGVGVFFAAGFFFFGDVFGFGDGDLAGVGELSAALGDLSVDETSE